MNKYPAWLNSLVLIVVISGVLLALPNMYGSAPAVQLAAGGDDTVSEQQLGEFVRVVENAGVTPEAAYLRDGRAVIRFNDANEQKTATDVLTDNYDDGFGVAPTVTARTPAWARALGLSPMSLGLDLRGGVYVLLEVDMNSAIETRLQLYALFLLARAH